MADETELNITLKADGSQAVSTAGQVKDAYAELVSAINSMGAQVSSAVNGVSSSLEKMASATNTHANTTKNGLSKIHDETKGLTAGMQAFGEQFEHAFSAKTLLEEFAHGLVGIVGPLALVEAGLEAVKEVVHEIVEFSKEGIIKADVLRDLSLGIDTFTHRVGSGSETLEFFEKNL